MGEGKDEIWFYRTAAVIRRFGHMVSGRWYNGGMALTPKQERFVAEYLVDLNATQAAIRAGYSAATAEQQGPRLLGNVGVASAISDGRQRQQERIEITADDIARELANVAFATLDDVAPWDEDGPHLIPSRELSRDKRAMVASIKVKRERPWRGQGEESEPWEVEHIEIKPWDKLKALELLGKRFGMFTDKVEQSGALEITVVRKGRDTDNHQSPQ